jgi:hypothetical protein
MTQPQKGASPETVNVAGKFYSIKPTILMTCMRKQMLLVRKFTWFVTELRDDDIFFVLFVVELPGREPQKEGYILCLICLFD